MEALAKSLQGRSEEGPGVAVPFLGPEWGPAMPLPGSDQQHPGSFSAPPAPGQGLESGGVGGREEPEPSHSSSCVSPQRSLSISELWSIYLNLKAWGGRLELGLISCNTVALLLILWT